MSPAGEGLYGTGGVSSSDCICTLARVSRHNGINTASGFTLLMDRSQPNQGINGWKNKRTNWEREHYQQVHLVFSANGALREVSADSKGTNTADVIVLSDENTSATASHFSVIQICPCAFMDDKLTKVNFFRRWLGWVLVHNPVYWRLSRLCVSQCFLSHSRPVWINSTLKHT